MIIPVELGPRSYPVYLDEPGTFADVMKDRFGDRPPALVTNTTIAGLYREQLDQWKKEMSLVVHTIEDGEVYKTLNTWQGILDSLLNSTLDRRAVVIAFGGGVVGDLAGFAAAAFLRGVDCVQVPTTLLAMVDSSVGGKTGVNHGSGKNRIGAFHQPKLVWIDTSYLNTLPDREFLAGYGEVFKYAFIGGRAMFDFIRDNHERILAKEPCPLAEAIKRSVEIKAKVVAEDERESGNRALLNYGHTFGHSLENYYNYEKVLHGEAVLWGMRCACDLGTRAKTIPAADQADYDALIAKMPAIQLPDAPSVDDIYKGMFTDKKVHAGKLRLVVPTKTGCSKVTGDISEELIRQSIGAVLAESV